MDNLKASEHGFGETIRKSRMDLRISIRDAAKRLNLSVSYLSSLEHNTNGYVPSDEVIKKISKLLKLNYSELRELSITISKDLKSIRRKASSKDLSEISFFYKLAKKYNLSLKEAVEIFQNSVEANAKKKSEHIIKHPIVTFYQSSNEIANQPSNPIVKMNYTLSS